MRTCTDLVHRWGYAEMAADTGKSYHAVANWSLRNAIPFEVFPQLVLRAPLRGIDGITYELLHSLQRGPTATPKRRPPKKSARSSERTEA